MDSNPLPATLAATPPAPFHVEHLACNCGCHQDAWFVCRGDEYMITGARTQGAAVIAAELLNRGVLAAEELCVLWSGGDDDSSDGHDLDSTLVPVEITWH